MIIIHSGLPPVDIVDFDIDNQVVIYLGIIKNCM